LFKTFRNDATAPNTGSPTGTAEKQCYRPANHPRVAGHLEHFITKRCIPSYSTVGEKGLLEKESAQPQRLSDIDGP